MSYLKYLVVYGGGTKMDDTKADFDAGTADSDLQIFADGSIRLKQQ